MPAGAAAAVASRRLDIFGRDQPECLVDSGSHSRTRTHAFVLFVGTVVAPSIWDLGAPRATATAYHIY
nr:unnamed protein product [Digitaria exilis]